MSADIEMSHPLRWPGGRSRSREHKPALFRHEGAPLTLTPARKRLREQISALTKPGQGWRTANLILSTNIRFSAAEYNLNRRPILGSVSVSLSGRVWVRSDFGLPPELRGILL